MANRVRASLLAVICVAAAMSACSSNVDDLIGAETPTSTDAITASTLSPAEPETDAGSDDEAETCGGITAAEVTAAIGSIEFDEAVDASGPDDTTCLFTKSGDTYAVSVRTEAATTYDEETIADLRPAAQLDALEADLVSRYDGEPAVERLTIEREQAVIVTGIDSIVEASGGTGALVADDVVVIAEAAGPLLSTDAPGFVPIVTNLLTLAVEHLAVGE